MRTKYSGIYQIQNIVNGKSYIGQSIDLTKRLDNHRRKLRNGTSHNSHLQSSWNKYGENKFLFQILIYLDSGNLDFYEQMFIEKLRPEYNKRLDCKTNRGYHLSDLHKDKLRIRQLGKLHTEESKAKISKSLMGHAPWGLAGKHHSEEAKKKMSKSILDYWSDKTKVVSDYTKKKLSASKKEFYRSGGRNPNSKISPQEVIKIRKERSEGETKVELGKRYGISPYMVYLICSGKAWKDVKEFTDGKK